MTARRRPATASRKKDERRDRKVVADIEFDEDDDLFDADDNDYIYNTTSGYWQPRPVWMHPECVDPSVAMEHGTCCKYPEDALVTRALDLAESVERTLSGFDRGNGDCAQTARELVRLLESLPALIREIHATLPASDPVAAAQLLCPVGRLILLVIELSGRSGCPLACSDHGAPDRRAAIAPLVPMLEACDEALWAIVLPRPRRRQSAKGS